MSLTESVRGLLGDEGVRMGRERVEPFQLTENVVYEVMKSYRRRLVISYLVKDANGECTISDLAEYIGSVENGIKPDDLTSKERKRVYVGLYQCHLPRMDEAGVIQWNPDRGKVIARDVAPALQKIATAVGSVAGGVPK